MKLLIGNLLFTGAVLLWHIIKCKEEDEESVSGELYEEGDDSGC